MPTLSQIFSRTVKDRKAGTCTHIKAIDTPPYIRRCTSKVKDHFNVCERHGKTVTYKHRDGETRTLFFNNKTEAEWFRVMIPDRWLATNYGVKR